MMQTFRAPRPLPPNWMTEILQTNIPAPDIWLPPDYRTQISDLYNDLCDLQVVGSCRCTALNSSGRREAALEEYMARQSPHSLNR